MFASVIKTVLVAAERRALQACARSQPLHLSCSGRLSLATACSRGKEAEQSHCLRCFASAALPRQFAAVQDEAAAVTPSRVPTSESWLGPERAADETASRQATVLLEEERQGRRPDSQAAAVVHLEKEGSSDDHLEDLDWSASIEESTERQTRFSPFGRRPKLKRSIEKPRKGVGRQAIVPPLPDFDVMVARLQAYKDKFGDCLVPKRFWEDFELGDWASRVRNLLKDKDLSPRKFEVLDEMGFPWSVPVDVASWEFMYQEMRRYKEEYGNLDVPFKWKDPMADFNNHFARWFHAQPTLFLQRRLRADQVRKLLIAGYDMQKVTGDMIGQADYISAQKEIGMTGEKAEFEIMFAEMEAWKSTYYTTVIPRMVYDNPVLGMWAWKIRRDQRQNKLAQWKIDRLNDVEFLWKVDPQTAKWHHNLHEARRYKEVHGTANIPIDYRNPAEPAWQEASQWLQRQAKLFRKQKLSDKRYRIMREVLGIKFVRQYAPRVKENRRRMGIQAAPGKRLPKYAPPLKRNMLI